MPAKKKTVNKKKKVINPEGEVQNYDEVFPDETEPKILRAKDMVDLVEEVPEEEVDEEIVEAPRTRRAQDQLERVSVLINEAITLLNRNISNKGRCIEKLRDCLKIIERLR